MMIVSDNFSIEKSKEIMNGIFIALPKKTGENECELHQPREPYNKTSEF